MEPAAGAFTDTRQSAPSRRH